MPQTLNGREVLLQFATHTHYQIIWHRCIHMMTDMLLMICSSKPSRHKLRKF